MDDNTLNTQYTDIAQCVKELGLIISEADGVGGPSKIVAKVLKLIQSFRLLGQCFQSELLKKTQELESKNRELADLTRKLQQAQLQCNSGAFVGRMPEQLLDSRHHHQQQQHRKTEVGAFHSGWFPDMPMDERRLFEWTREN